MDAHRAKPVKTCYWFINYTTRSTCSTRDHYCSSFACDLCQNSTRLMQNVGTPPGATVVRSRYSGQDCGQMIKTARMRSHSDKTIHMRNLDRATRPRLRRSARHSGEFIHSFIMLTLLNLILLLYHLEAPLVTRGANDAGFVLFAQAEENESMIEVRRFLVPAQVRSGELRRLACQYELHGASLHAMKLFKDDKEFYRYTPSNPPGDQRLSFPGAGVQVDMSRSGEREVWLKINKRSTGQYRCQVTIEGKFISVSAEKRMEVITGVGSQSGDPFAGNPQTGGGGGGGGGMWRHHSAPGGPRAPELPLPRSPGEIVGPNTVMQSGVGVPASAPSRHVLCACLLLAACSIVRRSLQLAAPARAR